MAKIILKGFVKEVGPIEEVGEKKTKKQQIIFFVPGYTDNFGEKKGRDEHWPIDIMGEKVAALNVNSTAIKQKAEIVVYVGASSYEKKDLAGTGYIINANLAEIKLLGASTNPVATEKDPW